MVEAARKHLCGRLHQDQGAGGLRQKEGQGEKKINGRETKGKKKRGKSREYDFNVIYIYIPLEIGMNSEK